MPSRRRRGASRTNDDEMDGQTYSSGRTLATHVTTYRYEHGRRYHSYRDGEYYQPNDEKQQDYEQIAHHLWHLTLDDELFLAPVKDPKRVLDIGTGTGLWAIDMADRYPNTEIVGTDLSPTQVSFAPPNVRFEIDDCCSEWTYPPNHFDFIHIRALLGSIADWPALYKECYNHLQPGGYIEQLEFSLRIRGEPQLPPEHVFSRWSEQGIKCGELWGKTMEIAEKMRGFIEDAGFVDVTEQVCGWPMGPWSDDEKLKELGRWNLRNWEEGMEGWILMLYTRFLGWSYEAVQEFLNEVRAAMKDRTYKIQHDVHVVWARKPS